MRSTKEKNSKLSRNTRFSERKSFVLRKNLVPPEKSSLRDNSILRRRTSLRPTFHKRGLRANGLSLLPLALRPSLLIVLPVLMVFAIVSSVTNNVSASSMTLTLPDSISLNISPTAEGSFAKSKTAEISAKTDSISGYTLSIKSKDTSEDGNCLKNGNSKITSITEKMTEEDYKNSGTINTWAFQPTKFNSLANTDFLPTPTSNESVIDKTKLGNTDAPNKYGIVIAAKVDTSIPTGIYTNTQIITMSSNELSYSVHFNLNGGSGGPANPQSGTIQGNTFILDNKIPVRKDYDFKGWCTIATEDDTCNGGIYQPGKTFTINCDTNNLELYAMWKFDPEDMQKFKCTLLEGDIKQIKDNRDENLYNIAKLKDGKCWMIENLRLGDSKLSNRTLTPQNTDISSNYTLPESNTSGFYSYIAENIYVGGQYNSGYYTYNAATAGTGNSLSLNGTNASGSICPKGWKLPTINELQALMKAYNSEANSLINDLPGFTLSGRYYESSFHDADSYGFYWSSTIFDSSNAFSINLTSSSTNWSYIANRYSGDTIRCIARE